MSSAAQSPFCQAAALKLRIILTVLHAGQYGLGPAIAVPQRARIWTIQRHNLIRWYDASGKKIGHYAYGEKPRHEPLSGTLIDVDLLTHEPVEVYHFYTMPEDDDDEFAVELEEDDDEGPPPLVPAEDAPDARID